MGDCKIARGEKQSEICCCFRPKDILCDKIVQANVGERESSREWQQNDGPPSKDYERKLTLIAENMRQLIDRQMTGHIKCTHSHTHAETDRHSRIVVKQLRRQTVPTSSWELRGWHLIWLNLMYMCSTWHSAAALRCLDFTLPAKKADEQENPKMQCQSSLTVRNSVYS